MGNSKLIDYKKISPNKNIGRNHRIDTITPHCIVGQLDVESIGSYFAQSSVQASCNYGIGMDGKIILVVDEKDRSWCSSSSENDNRAVTIECASDRVYPYTMNNAVYQKLIILCTDICKRNGKMKLLWLGSKEKTLSYEPKENEMVLTAHRWFKNKECPGEWLYSRYGELAEQVTNHLKGMSGKNTGEAKYTVQVGSFSIQDNAKSQVSGLKAAGFSANIKKKDGEYKVTVGKYQTKKKASATVEKLKQNGVLGYIVKL